MFAMAGATALPTMIVGANSNTLTDLIRIPTIEANLALADVYEE
jgi:hypothetical protein